MIVTVLGQIMGTLAAFRSNAARLLWNNTPALVCSRNVVHKSRLLLPDDYPEPWDYKTKGYNYGHAVQDRTQSHLHKNSKLIVIEGNIGSGKVGCFVF